MAEVTSISSGPQPGPGETEPPAPVRLELASERIQVRELIARAVREQVAELAEERDPVRLRMQRALERQYLNDADIEALRASGRVALQDPIHDPISPDRAVESALRGFEKRRFFVLVNGERATRLDEELVLTPQSQVHFVRLVPLQGG